MPATSSELLAMAMRVSGKPLITFDTVSTRHLTGGCGFFSSMHHLSSFRLDSRGVCMNLVPITPATHLKRLSGILRIPQDSSGLQSASLGYACALKWLLGGGTALGLSLARGFVILGFRNTNRTATLSQYAFSIPTYLAMPPKGNQGFWLLVL